MTFLAAIREGTLQYPTPLFDLLTGMDQNNSPDRLALLEEMRNLARWVTPPIYMRNEQEGLSPLRLAQKMAK